MGFDLCLGTLLESLAASRDRRASGWALPQPTAKAVAAPAASASPWRMSGSLRVREERWDWFGARRGNHYTFSGVALRLRAERQNVADGWLFELRAPFLLGLPKDATLSAPAGQQGHGANYRDANQGQEFGAWLKQGFYRRAVGSDLTVGVGRFEFSDGLELSSRDVDLQWLKRERLSQRLIGPFGFTHGGRSFDGLLFTRIRPKEQITTLLAAPTQGVFDLDGMGSVESVQVGYGSVVRRIHGKRLEGEARVFAIQYADRRGRVLKSDSRPLAKRAADGEPISIQTLGAHSAVLKDLPFGRVDLLAWGAFQTGAWGQQSHAAGAFAIETGFQPRRLPWKPWLRAGWSRYGGDGNPADGRHETFFPILPTPRLHARFPFYTLSNLSDQFAEVRLQPDRRTTVRLGAHQLRLAKSADLWYAGGGVFQDLPSFGYSGKPSGGQTSLGCVLDLGVDRRVTGDTDLSLYSGWARGSDVARGTFGGRGALYVFLELNRRW